MTAPSGLGFAVMTQPREFYKPGVGFRVADTVPGRFLDQLDDLLFTYGDSILPTHTSTQVYVQATAGDEAQIAMERRYFISATDMLIPVSGPADTYHLYGAASYVPTSHATTVKTFDLVVSTTPPEGGYEYVRHLAEVEWSGSQIEAVWQDPHRLNVELIDGHDSSFVPTDGVIPIASSNGKLHHNFRPFFPGVDAELGEVVDFWRPDNSPLPIHPAWELCDGRVIPAASHHLGPFALQLPDLRDKVVVGADPAQPYGQQSAAVNSAAGAPGIAGEKPAHMSSAVFSHDHPLPAHSHTATHSHLVNAAYEHVHNFNDPHTHNMQGFSWDRDDAGGMKSYAKHPDPSASGPFSTGGADPSASLDTVSISRYNIEVKHPLTNTVTEDAAGANMSADARPRFGAFARIMKVRQ